MKKANINEWMWLVVLFTYVAYFSSLLGNGKITLFIHPKMTKYIIFTVVIFIILISQQVKKLESSSVKKFKYSYLIFLVPIILATVVNPTTLSAKVIANKGVEISKQINSLEMTIESSDVVSSNIEDSFTGTDLIPTDSIPTVAQQDNEVQYESSNYNTEDGAIFLETIDTITSNLTGILGQETEIEGFIYLQDGFEENQFVVSRYMMNCCAADAQIIGILCYYTGDFEFKADQWVKVTGIIDKTMYKSIDQEEEIEMALIKVAEIQLSKAPEDLYVYPY